MRAFIVELQNQPGSLAAVCEALGERGINISGVAGMTWDGDGAVGMITNDDAGTRTVLDGRSESYREVDLVVVGLTDRPGSLGEAARRLADGGVNLEAVMPTSVLGNRVTVAFAVNDAAKAREALGDLIAAGSTAI